MNSKIQI